MDPTPSYCKIYDSFFTSVKETKHIVNYYTNIDEHNYVKNISTDINENIYNCEKSLYYSIQETKELFYNQDFLYVRNELNPFEKLGTSIFINRAGVKLGNIDAIIPLTGSRFTPLFTYNPSRILKFCDLAGGPGAFSQYIIYRYPKSIGYGITLTDKNQSLNWNKKVLGKNYNFFYGNEGKGNGDLLKFSDQFIEFVNKNEDGIDLVTADAGIETETNFKNEEHNMTPLFLSQCFVALHVLKRGGNFVIKTFDTVLKISEHIIYLLSICFDKIAFIKPISSRPANSEKYLVCIGLKNNIEKEKNIFQESYIDYIKYNKKISSLISDTSLNFKNWLKQNNNLILKNQYKTCSLISDVLSGQEIDKPEDYNLNKIFTLWALPDNKTKKEDAIKAYS